MLSNLNALRIAVISFTLAWVLENVSMTLAAIFGLIMLGMISYIITMALFGGIRSMMNTIIR